jgi:hypothetical protein
MNEKEAGQILRASCFHILELFEKGFVNYSSALRTSQERLANEELQYQVEIGESFVISYRALAFTWTRGFSRSKRERYYFLSTRRRNP